MRLLSLLLIASACFGQSWYPGGWRYRKSITVDQTKVGTGGVTNFPMYVDWASDSHIIAQSQTNGNDILFTSSDGTTKLSHELERMYTVAGNGMIGNPGVNAGQCVRVGDYTYVGFLNRAGTVGIMQYRHSTGVVVVADLYYQWSADDHNVPALLVLPSGKLMVAIAQHSPANQARIITQDTLNDASAWTTYDITSLNNATTGAFGWAYVRPVILSNGTIYLFWRGKDYQNWFSTATEASLTSGAGGWASPVQLTSNPTQRPYLRIISDGTSLHFTACSGQAAEVSNNHLYYGRFDGAHTIYSASGSTLSSSLPITITSLEKIYDDTVDGTTYYGAQAKDDHGSQDIALDASGYPVVAYAVDAPGSVQRARYHRWTGAAWVDNAVATVTSGTAYAGIGIGLVLNQANPNEIMYITPYGGAGLNEVKSSITANNGTTWTTTTLSHAPGDYWYPGMTLGYSGTTLKYLWTEGRGTAWTGYTDYISRVVTDVPIDLPTSAWVRVPSVSSSVATKVYIYYGNSAATDQGDSAATFSGWTIVGHMQREGLADNGWNNALGGIVNKSDSNIAETHSGPLTATGTVRGGQVYSLTHQTLDLGTTSPNLAGADSVTISGWVKGAGMIASSLPVGGGCTRAWMFLRTNAGGLEANACRADGTSSTRIFTWSPGITFDSSAWHYVMAIYDKTGAGLMAWASNASGVLQAATNPLASAQFLHATATNAWHIGSSPNGSTPMVGTLDEVRVRLGTAMTLADATTELANQGSPSTFYAFGSLEGRVALLPFVQ